MMTEKSIHADIVEFCQWGILTTDLTGTIVTCNPSFLKITGYDKEQIIGSHFSKIPALPIRDISLYEALFNDLIAGQEKISFKIEWHHQDGLKRFAKCHYRIYMWYVPHYLDLTN